MTSIKTLVLEYVDREGAAHIRELQIKHEYCVVFRKTTDDIKVGATSQGTFHSGVQPANRLLSHMQT